MKKKRKRSKNFPCNECQRFQDECVPSLRKMRSSAVSNVDDEGDAPNEETGDATRQEPAAGLEKKVVRDHNDANRRYLVNLPQVVDGCQEWSNMRTKHNPIPEALDEIREKLFKLEKLLLLNSQQYADCWPHISNIWARGVRYDSVSRHTSSTQKTTKTTRRALGPLIACLNVFSRADEGFS
jgi:hypothetical protein